MPETRMVPHKGLRSTGIERVNQVTRPTTSGATGAGSHVSAAPGVEPRVHDHVVAARNPAGTAGTPVRVAGRQDAKVELIDRRATPQGTGRVGLSVDAPTVQLLDQLPRRGADLGFTVPQLTLIGALLGKYEEGVLAVGNAEDAQMARDAIEKIRRVIVGTPAVAVVAAPARQVAGATPGQAPSPDLSTFEQSGPLEE